MVLLLRCRQRQLQLHRLDKQEVNLQCVCYIKSSRVQKCYAFLNKKVIYRKRIVHQLCTKYVEGIYSNSVTLRSRLTLLLLKSVLALAV